MPKGIGYGKRRGMAKGGMVKRYGKGGSVKKYGKGGMVRRGKR